MAIQHLRLSALLAVLLQLGCAAKPIHSDQVLDFPPKKDTLMCDNNGNCKVWIYAQSDSASHCNVIAEYKNIRVSANRTPTITWQINPMDPGQPYDYRFTLPPDSQGNGIEILANTPQDFANPGYGKKLFFIDDDTKFRWDDVHARSLPNAPFDYNLHVVRSPHNQNDWSTTCDMVDPRIVNE